MQKSANLALNANLPELQAIIAGSWVYKIIYGCKLL